MPIPEGLVSARARSVESDSAPAWIAARQAPLSVELSRQEYWNGWPFPSPGYLPDPGIILVSLVSPALAGGFFTAVPTGKPLKPGLTDFKAHVLITRL